MKHTARDDAVCALCGARALEIYGLGNTRMNIKYKNYKHTNIGMQFNLIFPICLKTQYEHRISISHT